MDKKFKIIIGVLSAAVAVLAIVLIYVWSDRNSYINELTIDKENLTAEMLQLQQDYAQLSSTNDTLNNEILLEREKVAQLIERVQKTEATNKAMLRKYEKELANIFITSQAELIDSALENALNKYEEDGYTIYVTHAHGEKCDRCWKYRKLINIGPQGSICQDCINAINGND